MSRGYSNEEAQERIQRAREEREREQREAQERAKKPLRRAPGGEGGQAPPSG